MKKAQETHAFYKINIIVVFYTSLQYNLVMVNSLNTLASAVVLASLPIVSAEARDDLASLNGALALDGGIESAVTDVSQSVSRFQVEPSRETLQGVHLACRDLKSQLNRYSSYFGAEAVQELKSLVLPVVDAAISSVKANQKNSGLGAQQVNLTLQTADFCLHILTPERQR